MERSFAKEIELLKLGDGEVFQGEGILAVSKALLQSGISYVGGYQGAPITHLLDVFFQAEDLLEELGVSVTTCTSETAAAAMCGASINYHLRGAVSWKSVVGTNVAADPISHLASSGVTGGVLFIIGEDYGEGASIMQERSHSFAMKSSLWYIDPKPNLTTITDLVEKGFELSEISNTPVMFQLRIRACHVQGSFIARDNKRGQFSGNAKLSQHDFDYNRLCHPPSTFAQEKHKVDIRIKKAQEFILDQNLNEIIDGDFNDVGLILQGGLYNSLQRALVMLELSNTYGDCEFPQLILNVTHPLVPSQIEEFCLGKKAVLVIEEGNPEYIEHQITAILGRADIQTKVHGKDFLPMAGEYRTEVIMEGLTKYFAAVRPQGLNTNPLQNLTDGYLEHKEIGTTVFKEELPGRPPGFCTGCPERPIFSAIKLVNQELGETHVSADIGCHALATLPPFNQGNTIMGYGMSLAGSMAIAPNFNKRVISIMGDGGFWHNGLTTGVASTIFNQDDSILIIMRNGYTSATGWQYLPSSSRNRFGTDFDMPIDEAVKGLGAKWVRTIDNYNTPTVVNTIREARTTTEKGLKVIIAEGECQLARQRRLKTENKEILDHGGRLVRTRFAVDDEICTGDHSCIRLSGCPSLTIKPNPNPLKEAPVAHVQNDCVGCGLCGELAQTATLCPSFFKIDVLSNPNWLDKAFHGMRRAVIGWLQGNQTAAQQS